MADNTEVVNVPASNVISEIKKVKKTSSGIKRPAVKPNHPPTAQMVDSAIKTLKERGGSSLLAIKKYLAANYKVDADKLAPFIKKYLKSSVESGRLIQTKGKGASGSFKLSAAAIAAKPKKEAKPKIKKLKVEKKSIKKSTVNKKSSTGEKKKKTSISLKKQSTDKKKSEKSTGKLVKKTGTVKSKISKQKPTKPSKTDVKKLKTPKPKKAVSPKKLATKKIAKK
jgi:histone H1/5